MDPSAKTPRQLLTELRDEMKAELMRAKKEAAHHMSRVVIIEGENLQPWIDRLDAMLTKLDG